MRKINCVSIMIVLMVTAACKPAEPPPQDATRLIVAGNTNFACGLYAKLHGQQGNLFFSPYSISTALAMTSVGARGPTELQMAKTLQFPTGTGNENFHKEFTSIIRQLNQAGAKGGFELVVANALWGQKDYKFLPDFLSLVKTNYDGDLQQVDFVGQTETARKTINDWVESKTKDKIKELIKQGTLDSMTRLVLTNAIYFKGKWASQFKPEQTMQEPFILLTGEKKDVPMMNQTADFNYMETADLQGLAMPYVGNELSMIVLLPKKLDGIKNLEEQLTADNISTWLGRLRKREVWVSFPKFKTTSEFGLADVLQSMGMTDAFLPDKADFSGITGNKDLFISAVVHKAYIDVNEEGTEAAAATGVTMKLTSVGPAMPVFRADHPFIFLIRDNLSGSILFIGRVTDPSAGY
jgi:serpin B